MSAQDLIAHALSGAGEPLLLLNGGMMSYAAWEPIAAPLRQRYQVLGCDFRGQLLSPGPVPEDLEGHAADVARLLEHLELPPVHVLGTSFGGEVAAVLAARRPELVRSLVLATVSDLATEAMHEDTVAMREIVAGILAGGDRGRFHDRLVERIFSPEYRERLAAEMAARRAGLDRLPTGWFSGLDGLLAAIESFDLRALLPAIECPTLIVVAAADEVMPPERSRRMAAAIPGASLRVHPTSGHALVSEDPQWLVEVCLDFFDGVSSRSDP
ncbi:MAG: alpha/beta fold hydrolase [Acidobacteria bacterium]|nr:alpha/beta fold hydrolase [Acidobacteriota bacterium]